MPEPRKLGIIGHCAQCPDYIWQRSKLSGWCRQAKQPVEFGYGPIAEFCPLPDAPKEETGKV